MLKPYYVQYALSRKEGGDLYTQVGEVPKYIIGIVRSKRRDCQTGVLKRFYPLERRDKK